MRSCWAGNRPPTASCVRRFLSSTVCKRALPVRIVTVILAGEALQLRQSDSNLVLSRDASQVYQVSLAPEQTVRAKRLTIVQLQMLHKVERRAPRPSSRAGKPGSPPASSRNTI